MTRLPMHGLLAFTLMLAPMAPALAADAEPRRLENSLTAGGLNIAPRYLDQVGDVDLNLLFGFSHFPTTNGIALGGQLGLQTRLLDQLQLLANAGPLTELGIRGPLYLSPMLDLGWDARYRSEIYFANSPGFGLTSPLLTLSPGAAAHGSEFKLNAAAKWQGFTLFLSPLAAWMSNRTALGLEGGLDWAFQRWGLGYSLAYRENVSTPFPGSGVLPRELQHGLGLRFSLDEKTFLQANGYLTPGDTYGTANRMLLVGFGRRLFSTFQPPDLQALLPLPKSTPVAVAPTPQPTPEPTQDPVVVEPTPEPVVVEPTSVLRGRLLHSLRPKAEPGIPVTLELKRRSPEGFVLANRSTVANPDGTFAFEGLPDGEYQLVYRDHPDLPHTPAVLVSRSMRVSGGSTAEMTLDLAWDDAGYAEALQDGRGEIRWSPRSDAATYQLLVRQNAKNILAFPGEGTDANQTNVTLSAQAREHQPAAFVKFWQKGDAFGGAGPYGQSRPRPLAPQQEDR